MATTLRSKSFQKNLLFSIGGVFLLFAICFSAYQYRREKEYKIDILHARLQMYNHEMAKALGKEGLTCDTLIARYIESHSIQDLRITIVNLDGHVLYDNHESDLDALGSHLHRTEIQQALRNGSGYDLKRLSSSTKETYFYSATRFGYVIVRAAVPYSAELTRSLQADSTYLYFALALTLLLGIVLYLSTRRISRHIGHLREFAVKAEAGEELDHELERRLPDDELGDISHTIIQLYWKLRHSEEDKLRIKRQLTQNAAHELKTPAASIHGYLESILDNPDMPADKRQHFLERCYAQSQRMNNLLLDMTVLTRLDEMGSGTPESRKDHRQVDVRPIIQAVIDDTALQLQEKGIEVSNGVTGPVLVFGDPGLIYGIFRNLIDNVIQHAAGATRVAIAHSYCQNNGHEFCHFAVSDNGQGVEPPHLPLLFERFYRVDKGRSRKMGGTGLGLSIVKNSVMAHGGTATAENTPGGGLTIHFLLPRQNA